MGVGQLIKNAITADQKAVANGIASLDSNTKIPKAQINLLPSDINALALSGGSLSGTTESTSESTGTLAIPSGGVGIGGNCFVKGFIISEVAYKTKIIRGTTASGAGGSTSVPIGITSSKIIGLDVLIDYSSDNSSTWIRSTNKSGFQFHVFIEAGGINLRVELTASQSNNILSKSFVALITYTS